MNEYALLADSLNKNKEGIPRARRIHANLDKIEALLSTGITAKYLVQCLNESGFEVTLNNFNIELYRARKKKRGIKKDSTIIVNNETATINKPVIESTPKTEDIKPKENKPLTTKEIMAETERYNEQHEVEKAKKTQTQRDEKLLALINKQNKGK
jgi:LAS superfamily LD-carboxypeptidase LdcB